MGRYPVLTARVLLSLFWKIHLPGILGTNVAKLKEQRKIDGLIRALDNPDPEVQFKAATALAAIGRPAVEPLIRFLKFTRGEIRIEVVRAAGDLHADDALQPLVQLLENAGDREGGDLGSAERNSCNDRGSDGRRYIGPAGNGR